VKLLQTLTVLSIVDIDYTKQDIQDALAKYHRSGCSIRAIALEFGIPRATLQDHLSGTQTHSTVAELHQTFSRVQEDYLV
jgi:phage portal protein BeeE